MSQSDNNTLKKRLHALLKIPQNRICADCPTSFPTWASILVPPPGAAEKGCEPMGVFCCLQCSGSHRRLGVHIAFVRSIDLDEWREKDVLAMENGGNEKVNAIFEANIGKIGKKTKPHLGDDCEVRTQFIRKKYEDRLFYDGATYENYFQTEQETSKKKNDHLSLKRKLSLTSSEKKNNKIHSYTSASPPEEITESTMSMDSHDTDDEITELTRNITTRLVLIGERFECTPRSKKGESVISPSLKQLQSKSKSFRDSFKYRSLDSEGKTMEQKPNNVQKNRYNSIVTSPLRIPKQLFKRLPTNVGRPLAAADSRKEDVELYKSN